MKRVGWIALSMPLFALTACEDVMSSVLHTHVDDDCRAAMRHLSECCPNFHDGAVSCLYEDRGISAGRADITRSQAECIQRQACSTVRTAALGYDAVCGFEMRRSLMSDGACDAHSLPPKGKRPSESGD
jgi:hypothetical protein